MHLRVLIDACVLLDATMPFRPGHNNAHLLFSELKANDAEVYLPSHAYFEIVTALVIHYKRDLDEFTNAPFSGPDALSNVKLHVVSLDEAYVRHLMKLLQTAPMPDLKSQDMIYFCIAKDKQLTLITEDRKLRNLCRRAGLSAENTQELRVRLAS